jgi:hypothetical protein
VRIDVENAGRRPARSVGGECPVGCGVRIGLTPVPAGTSTSYDTIGGDVLADSPAIFKPGGALVSVMAAPQTDRDDVRTVHFVRDPSGAQLRDITRLVDEGKLRPQVGAVYPLADAREVFMAKSTHHIPGKVVLTPSPITDHEPSGGPRSPSPPSSPATSPAASGRARARPASSNTPEQDVNVNVAQVVRRRTATSSGPDCVGTDGFTEARSSR